MANLHVRSNSTKSKRNQVPPRGPRTAAWLRSFRLVEELASNLPNVTTATKYDGSPLLKNNGVFMAGIATHPSAEPDTLVLPIALEERAGLLSDAPETYYSTPYYQRFPVVLVRLSAVTPEILRQLLASAWRTTCQKSKPRTPKFN